MSNADNIDLIDHFPEVLRDIRLKNGISQEELAARAGLHRTYISQIERGLKSPSLRSLAQIADALDTRLSVIIRKLEGL